MAMILNCENCSEIWRDISDYQGLYQVSSCGRVRSLVSDKILKPVYYRGGYYQVGLYREKKAKKMKVHRLVAMAFIPNPDNKPEVNHLNEIKDFNCYKNLEWVTHSENVNYGTCILRGKLKQGRPIVQKTIDGEHVKIWECSTFLKESNFFRNEVWKCCNNRAKTHKGFVWEYADGATWG